MPAKARPKNQEGTNLSTLRRIDPQYRVSLPPEVRDRLAVDRDDFVVFDLRPDGVHIRKAKITVE